ncbi:MAG: phenylalanine--tRNA ligase subunit beta [Bacillota bacterium]|nr:phenylalanine--tRNA ligase subunit beta [Bacillota bacterium]
MKVSIKWLKQLVDYNATPEELADKLTMAGISVEGIEHLGEGLNEKIVVGNVAEVTKHPDADKLSVCQVNVGTEVLQIICGADNVVAGAKVVVALPGSILPGNHKIKKAKLRGVESNGMICSLEELGLNTNLFTKEEQHGILILSDEAKVGAKATDALGINDTVLTLELTPNRADCLSMINVAREVAAVTDGKLTLPEISLAETNEKIDGLANIKIEDPDLCKRYAGRIIKNVKLGPSPLWLQERLRACGVRPINNVVDITNYVMLEMGQPLHAFDYDLLTDKTIIVRKGQKGEKMVTLDGVERELEEDMLLITDPKGPVAIAGVMGGLDTEVTAKTVNILLESAYFVGTSIRKTSRRLGLRSEASQRFEKGINLDGVTKAIDRAAQLLQQLAAGELVKGIIDVYPAPYEPRQIELRLARVNHLLGTSLSMAEVEKIFNRLGFEFASNDSSFMVNVPSYRNDIELEVDLIEEIARLYGYENIETSLPEGKITQGKKKDKQLLEDQTKQLLVGLGFNEVINFSFTSSKVFDKLNLPQDHQDRQVVPLFNPLSEEQSVMRTTLTPGLLEVAAKNINRRTTTMAIFELGKKYLPSNELLPHEPVILAGLLTGKKAKGWGWAEDNLDFFTMKGVLDALFAHVGVGEVKYQVVKDNPVFHPGRTAEIAVNDQVIGIAGELHPQVGENFDLTQRCYVFEIDFDKLSELANDIKRYTPLPKHPATDRDLALLIKEGESAQDIIDVIKEAAGELLVDVTLFDQYKGAQIKEGYKSLAFNLVYQANDRTLTDEEINSLQNQVRQAVTEKLGAELR